MAGSFTIGVDSSQLNALLAKVVSTVDNAVRPAAQAGAQVIYEAVHRNVPQSGKGHWFHGSSFKLNGKKYWFDAGTLKRSIYQVYSKDNSGPLKATYHIAWNHQECPYGFMVEFGTSKAPAHPFLRPAAASAPAAEEAMKTKLQAALDSSGVVKR
jgi:HK97 gp10 family phage protein